MKPITDVLNQYANHNDMLLPSQAQPVEPDLISIDNLEKAKFNSEWWTRTKHPFIGATKAVLTHVPQFLGNTTDYLARIALTNEGQQAVPMFGQIGKMYYPEMGYFPRSKEQVQRDLDIAKQVYGSVWDFPDDAEQYQKDFVEMNKRTADMISQTTRALTDKNRDWVEKMFPTPVDNVDRFLQDVGGGVVSFAEAIALQAFSGGASVFAYFGLTEAGQKFREMDEAGVSVNKAILASTLSGFNEGALESISTLLAWNSTLPWLARGGMNAILEGTEEVLQSVSSDSISYIFGSREWEGKASAKQMVGSALYAGAIGTIIGGPGGFSLALGQRNRVQKILESGGMNQQQAKLKANEMMAKTATQNLEEMEKNLFGQMVKEHSVVMDAVTGRTLTGDNQQILNDVYQRYVDEGLIRQDPDADPSPAVKATAIDMAKQNMMDQNSPVQDSDVVEINDVISKERQIRESILLRDGNEKAIRKIEDLAQKLGVRIGRIRYEDTQHFMDWNNPEDQIVLRQHGETEESYNERIRTGRQLFKAGLHTTYTGRDGQQWSEIRLFRGFDSADIYHEFAHAVEEQGGIPGWAGSKEEHAHYIEKVIAEGREQAIAEFTEEGRRIDDRAKELKEQRLLLEGKMSEEEDLGPTKLSGLASVREPKIDPDSVDWAKVSNYMKRQGYDYRGAEDARNLFARMTDDFSKGINPKTLPDHANAIKFAGGEQIAEDIKDTATIEKVKKHFGTTDDFREAGYFTPDGSMIDLSGKREGGTPGMRSQDHREINAVDFKYKGGYTGTGSISDGMIYFMNIGNIRVQSNGINLIKKPTAKQMKLIKEHVESVGGEYYVDFSGEKGNVVASLNYDYNATPQKVARDINKFFSDQGLASLRETGESVPKFKNTEEAQAFGKIASMAQLIEMQRRRDEILARNKELLSSGNLTDEMMQKGMDEAVEAQLYRESIEASPTHASIRETPITEKDAKKIVEEGGGSFKAVQPAEESLFGEQTIWWDTPSGSTQSAPVSKFDVQIVRNKIDTYEQKASEAKGQQDQSSLREADIDMVINEKAMRYKTLEEFMNYTTEVERQNVLKKMIRKAFSGRDEQDTVAGQKIDKSLLNKLKGGSSREVYELTDDLVIKIAKTAKGLEQNAPAGDYYIAENEHFPKVFEIGKDYIVTEKILRNDTEVRKWLKPLQKFTVEDFKNKTSELQEVMEEKGLSDFLNYDVLWNDFIAVRNWGMREDGTPVLIDEGALTDQVHSGSTVDPYVQQEWQDVLQARRNAKGGEDVVSEKKIEGEFESIWKKAQDLASLREVPKMTREMRFAEMEKRIIDIRKKKGEYKREMELVNEALTYLQNERKAFKNNVVRYKDGYLDEEYNEIPVYYRSNKGGVTLDEGAQEYGFESDMSFRDYLIRLESDVKKLEQDKADLREKIQEDTHAKVVKSEIDYLKQRLFDFQQGKFQGRQELQAIKTHMGQIVRKVLPLPVRGKAITLVQNVNEHNFATSMNRIKEIYDSYQESLMRRGVIKKLLKSYKHPENVIDVRYQEVIDKVRDRLGEKKADKRKSLREMSTEELVSLARKISFLEEHGKLSYQQREANRAMAREIMRASLIKASGGEVDAGVIGSYEEKKLKGKGSTAFRRANIRPIELVEKIFGQYGKDMIYSSLDWSETVKGAGIFSRVNAIKQAFRKYVATKDNKIGDFIGEHNVGQSVTIDGTTFQINDIMAMYAQRNNEHARKAIIYGNNMPEALYDKFTSYLETEHPDYVKFVDEVKRVVGDRYEEARQVMADVFNIVMPKEADYFPMFRIRFDAVADPEAKFALDLIADAEIKSRGGVDYTGVEKGFTISRQEIADRNQQPISLDFMGDAVRAIETQEHFINFAKIQKMVNGLKSDKALRNSVTYNHGAQAWEALDAYLNMAVNPRMNKVSLDFWSKRAREMRKALGISYLGFNVVTALKQFPSAHLALPWTNPLQLYSSMIKVAGSAVGDQELINKIYELDPSIKNRVVSRDLQEFQRNYPKLAKNDVIRGLQIAHDQIGKSAFDLIMMMDKWAVLSVYDSVYESQKRNVGEAEARKIAHEVVLKTQPQGRMIDLPEIYRTNNEFLRMTLMFTNQLNQIYNMMREGIPNAITRKDYGNAVAQIASIMVSSLMIYLASHGGKFPDPDDEDVMMQWVDALAGSSIASFPVVGNIAMSAFRGYSPSINPTDSVIDSFKKSLWRFKNEQYARGAFETLVNVGILAGIGIPSTQPMRTINGAVDLMESNTEDWRRLIWSKSALKED